jgi:ribosomal protein S18 acetylase RimI-like enzyme
VISIRRMTGADAATYRQARLRALRDAPAAFGSSYARESAMTDAEWAARMERSCDPSRGVSLLALDGETCCGIIGCFRSAEVPYQAEIVSMWVAPEVRRRGVGLRLMEGAEAWARESGLRGLALDVTEGNTPAIELYRRCGFELTVQWKPYRNDPRLRELVMWKWL